MWAKLSERRNVFEPDIARHILVFRLHHQDPLRSSYPVEPKISKHRPRVEHIDVVFAVLSCWTYLVQVLAGGEVVARQVNVQEQNQKRVDEPCDSYYTEQQRHGVLRRRLAECGHSMWRVNKSVMEEVHHAKRGLQSAHPHEREQQPQEIPVVSCAHAIVEKLAVVVVVGNTHVALATVAHSRETPDVARGAVLHRHPSSGVAIVRKRNHVEVLVGRMVTADSVQVIRQVQIAGHDARVAQGGLDEKQHHQEPDVRVQYHRGRADIVPDPAGLKHPKEHSTDHNQRRHHRADRLQLDVPEPAAKEENGFCVVKSGLVVAQNGRVCGDDVAWVKDEPVGD